MKILLPSVKQAGTYRIKCPSCGKIADFSVFSARLSLIVKPVAIKKHGVAVCTSCGSSFRIKDDTAKNAVSDKGALTPFDLEPMNERKRKI